MKNAWSIVYTCSDHLCENNSNVFRLGSTVSLVSQTFSPRNCMLKWIAFHENITVILAKNNATLLKPGSLENKQKRTRILRSVWGWKERFLLWPSEPSTTYTYLCFCYTCFHWLFVLKNFAELPGQDRQLQKGRSKHDSWKGRTKTGLPKTDSRTLQP